MSTSSEIYNLIVSGSKDINSNLTSLTPSTPISFYEIDLSEISPNLKNFNNTGEQPLNGGVLRLYNEYFLYNISNNPSAAIKWKNNFYYPFPIVADGFDYTSAGTLPTPRLAMGNFSPDKSLNSFYKYIRMQIESLGDIVGAKFTRIKTFVKYLKGENFQGGTNIFNAQSSIYEVELPKEIYYIDRKTTENKVMVEYQLASVLDIENIVLPARTILAKKCNFQYRGENCCYEYNSRLTEKHSGCYAGIENNYATIRGLQSAPPVATENDQLFIGGIFSEGPAAVSAAERITNGLGNSGVWQNTANYVSGDFVFIEKNKLKYYFVCTNNHSADEFNYPPNTNYWVSDTCAKNINSCRLRWLKNPAFKPVIWPTDRNGETYDQTISRIFAQQRANSTIYAAKPGAVQYTANEVNSQWLTGINGTPVYFPRRPGAENPISEQAHGIPKDYEGNYLNGYLPFGGFPAASKPS